MADRPAPSGEFLHARLKLTGVATFYGEALDEGGFIRLSGDYELAEAQILTLGVIFMKTGSLLFWMSGQNDRLFAGLQLQFLRERSVIAGSCVLFPQSVLSLTNSWGLGISS